MRALATARRATYALALAISLPALADRNSTSRTLADCTTFDQADKGDSAVSFTIHNTCTVPIDCAVSWHVVCAPDSKKRRSVHASSVKLSLTESSMGATDADASTCGDDGWKIDDIQWSCQPNKD